MFSVSVELDDALDHVLDVDLLEVAGLGGNQVLVLLVEVVLLACILECNLF